MDHVSTLPEYFSDKTVRAENGCLLWTGRVESEGYGQLRVGGRLTMAHRHLWEVINGPLPDRLVLDHYRGCSRACCEPTHLRAVTNAENIRHRVSINLNNTSGHRGVSWDKSRNRWTASVHVNGKKVWARKYPPYELHVAAWETRMARVRLYGAEFSGLI